MSGQTVSIALKKEIRAVGPAALMCLVLFAAAPLVGTLDFYDVAKAIYFLGAIVVGALSMGHEYSGGTLSLLLSQPRRRASIVLLKLSVLVPILLTLAVLGFVLGGASPNARGALLVVPLLCGLFIAPWLTMLCRNALAGILFTGAIPGLLQMAGQIAAARKFGADPVNADASAALVTAVVLWGMVAISAVAAVSGWRLFMRLEAIDGRGDAFQFTWRRAAKTRTEAVPQFAKRHALWLLVKKELRLQQLSFIVGGLYVLGWVVVLAAKSAMPHTYSSLLFALTTLNALSVSVLAGSLASAGERQLGTLEWHTLLPASARTQWAVKAGTTVAVASLLGFAMPKTLAALMGSREIHDSMQPLLSPAIGYAVIVLTVMSLYISSLCATSVQAVLWSVATAVVLMAFTSGWADIFRLEWSYYTTPWLTPWRRFRGEPPPAGLIMLSFAGSALAITSVAGVIGFLLHFAKTNHRSAERSLRRVPRQLLSLVAFLGILQILASGVSYRYQVEASAYSRDLMNRKWGFVAFAVTDNQSRPTTSYTMVAFREDASPDGRPQRPRTIHPEYSAQRWPKPGYDIFLPGRYSIIAVEPIAQNEMLWDTEMIARLKAHAISFTIVAGEAKTLQLTLSKY